MRILPLAIALLFIAIPSALARPRTKIAVAPIQGDSGNKIAAAVVEALAGKDFVVVGPKEVRREATQLGASDDLTPRDARRLVKKLDVAAVIDGDIGKPGKKRMLHLEVYRRGRASVGFTIEFKSTSSPGFRRGIHDQILKKLETESEQVPDEDDEELAAKRAADDEARKRKAADDEAAQQRERDDGERKRKLADDRPRKRDERKRPARRGEDDDSGGKRTAARDDGERDDGRAVRKRRRDQPHLLLARVGAGLSVAQRELSYDVRSGFTQRPPRVLTTAGAGRVDGELYPFALGDPRGSLAPLGLAASYDKTFGLSIKVPNQTVSAPINQSHYALGVRYRFTVGDASTIALGLDYARRQYVADRAALMAVVLDAPDVDYSAIAPGLAARVPLTSSIAAIASLDGMLMLETGPIQATTSYGPNSVYGVEAVAGVDIQVASQLALRIAVEYSRIAMTFNSKGTESNARDNDPATQDVMGANDRYLGVAATLGLVY